MELFSVFSWCVLIIAAATLCFPLNICGLALSYKVRLGHQRLPFEIGAFWLRSTGAALALFLLTLIVLALAYGLAEGAELPAGPIHLLLFLAYLPAAVWILFVLFALEDMGQALSVFLLDILFVGAPLLLILRATAWWRGLAGEFPWLFIHS